MAEDSSADADPDAPRPPIRVVAQALLDPRGQHLGRSQVGLWQEYAELVTAVPRDHVPLALGYLPAAAHPGQEGGCHRGGRRTRKLFTCRAAKHGGDTPLIKHPCGVAAKALDEAGRRYDIEIVGGFKNLPFSRRGRRDQIVELTGQKDVPVLLLDDGTAVQGSSDIVRWASSHP